MRPILLAFYHARQAVKARLDENRADIRNAQRAQQQFREVGF